MKQTINLYEFRNAFNSMGRGDQFTYEGLEILFNGLEEFEEDTGEEIDLDVIAICCDFAEMTLSDIQHNYAPLFEDLADDEKATLEQTTDILNNQTWVIGNTPTTVIFRQF
jgi:hypothetical protein